MARYHQNLKKHQLIRTSTRKFDVLFRELQKQKKDIDVSASLDEFFLLEIQLINSYFQQLLQDLETISTNEPRLLIFETVENETKRNELVDIARIHLVHALNKYHNVDITKILISANCQ